LATQNGQFELWTNGKSTNRCAMASNEGVRLHRFRNKLYLEEDFETAQELVTEYSDELQEMPFILTSLGEAAMETAIHEWVFNKDSKEALQGLRLAHIAMTSHWAGMDRTGPHTVQLPDKPILTFDEIEPNSDVGLGSWLNGMYLAMIFRDVEAVKVYSEVDRDWLTTLDGHRPDPWEVPYIDFLSGIWNFDPKLLSHLEKVLLGTDPELYPPLRADYILNILSPQMELWAKVFSRDAAVANQGLLDQQTLRHDWHEALDEDTYNSIMEYIDLGALAAASYMNDMGLPVTVKSDYLPDFLIKGDFPKLEWPDPAWKA
jgi:hypothetical protein